MGVDLNKEIKLSELFRRKAKEGTKQPKAEQPKEEKPRRAPFARGPKKPREPKAEKAETAGRSVPALPQIPLMRAFNLLPGDEAQERPGRLGLPQVLVALLALLVVAGLGSGYLLMSARVAAAQVEKDDLRVQLADLDIPSEAPAPAEGDAELAGDGQARTTALAAALSARVAWDRVLREVTLVVPDEIWLVQVTARTPAAALASGTPPPADPAAASGSSIAINGRAETQDAVARFLARLGVIPELASVQLQTSAAGSGADDFTFAIVATVNPQGAAS
jgi:Tfp pilus assembly protein PilN